MRKLIFLTLVLVLIAGGGWWWKKKNSYHGPKILASATLKKGQVRKVLEATGIIKPQVGAIVKIGAQATGVITKMKVKVGDKVQKGQLVAEIDDREIRTAMVEAQSRLEKSRLALEKIKATYPLKIAQAKAILHQAKAKLDYTRSNFHKLEKLFQENLVSQDEFERAQKELAVESQNFNQASARLNELNREFAFEAKKSRVEIREAQAKLDALKVKLSYTKIYSPLTGYVSQVTAQEGETVVAGLQVANLITVLDPTRLEMWIYIDETDMGEIRPKQKVSFNVDAYPNKTFTGRIATIYPQPEIRDNIVYYQALVRITSEQARFLRPEMTAHCQIEVKTKNNVLALPNSALKWIKGKQVIFVQRPDGTVSQVKPKLGLSGLNYTEVISGLKPGDVVATQVVLKGE
ncbi:efflux RND transporter periplasmic adaptor subunit [Desulfohalobiaceae bacterium Ax17]|uniref:efflux RND transporter periplasmic adaptor subunit n=1 Tax=Desulfovulcanus ferrireducens TaxID=2831190 RepID=UPI00207BC22A|nr:efflux RND transporter periplasmic adaptor subunit [Desulfovulcanus ferrireducens]MBT8764212.1 efflux RND transporter periplasmic adaptor subunit [Desulfovulcanus ferrireducens]